MEILYELVTVMSKQEPGYHWETGKMADALIDFQSEALSRETCLHVVQKHLFQNHE